MNPMDSHCKNCGGSEIYSQEIDANGHHGPELLPLGFWSGATFRIRVCGNCGFVEWFVPQRHIPKVKERFISENPDAAVDETRPVPSSEVAGTPWEDNPGHTSV